MLNDEICNLQSEAKESETQFMMKRLKTYLEVKLQRK